MRSFLVFLLILASQAAAQTTSILSDPFILKPAKPKSSSPLPQITLLEPVVGNGGSVVEKTTRLAIRGVAFSKNGVRRVEINGFVTIPSESGGFVATLPLHTGVNQITVSLEDNTGIMSRLSFEVMCDLRAPFIEVLQPRLRELRGIRNVVIDTTVLIARVYDDCMLSDVTVNGVPIQVGQDSLIRYQVDASTAHDSLSIVARDTAGRLAKKAFAVSIKPYTPRPDFLAGKSYALVIGIDVYKGVWPRLKNAVNDARAVAQILSTQFEFERVDSLFDERATRRNIIDHIVSIGRSLQAEDRLMIYFSGHGLKEPPINKGYWVPVDATEQSYSQYISNRDIQDFIGSMNAKHVLLVADACFAGDIFKGGALRYEFEDNTTYYRKVASVKSRKALTSGGDEPVMDGGASGHSVFASYFLKALSEIHKPCFSASEVFERLHIAVTNNSDQMPLFDAIKNTGDEGGEFLFLRR